LIITTRFDNVDVGQDENKALKGGWGYGKVYRPMASRSILQVDFAFADSFDDFWRIFRM